MPKNTSRSEAGHNRVTTNGQLQSFVERVERLETEQAALKADKADVYTEIKSAGFDTKAVRALIKKRAADAQKVKELAETVELYEAALGGIKDLPLGQATIERVRNGAQH